MRPRAQTLGFAGSLLFRIGAAPPVPLAPWHPAHPFERYVRAPSLALPVESTSSAWERSSGSPRSWVYIGGWCARRSPIMNVMRGELKVPLALAGVGIEPSHPRWEPYA